jgi:hypothetical protein
MDQRLFYRFYELWITSVMFIYTLAVSWYVEAPVLYYISGVGGLLQTVAIGYFV